LACFRFIGEPKKHVHVGVRIASTGGVGVPPDVVPVGLVAGVEERLASRRSANVASTSTGVSSKTVRRCALGKMTPLPRSRSPSRSSEFVNTHKSF
jgi:hypothetical protein